MLSPIRCASGSQNVYTRPTPDAIASNMTVLWNPTATSLPAIRRRTSSTGSIAKTLRPKSEPDLVLDPLRLGPKRLERVRLHEHPVPLFSEPPQALLGALQHVRPDAAALRLDHPRVVEVGEVGEEQDDRAVVTVRELLRPLARIDVEARLPGHRHRILPRAGPQPVVTVTLAANRHVVGHQRSVLAQLARALLHVPRGDRRLLLRDHERHAEPMTRVRRLPQVEERVGGSDEDVERLLEPEVLEQLGEAVAVAQPCVGVFRANVAGEAIGRARLEDAHRLAEEVVEADHPPAPVGRRPAQRVDVVLERVVHDEDVHGAQSVG